MVTNETTHVVVIVSTTNLRVVEPKLLLHRLNVRRTGKSVVNTCRLLFDTPEDTTRGKTDNRPVRRSEGGSKCLNKGKRHR